MRKHKKIIKVERNACALNNFYCMIFYHDGFVLLKSFFYINLSPSQSSNIFVCIRARNICERNSDILQNQKFPAHVRIYHNTSNHVEIILKIEVMTVTFPFHKEKYLFLLNPKFPWTEGLSPSTNLKSKVLQSEVVRIRKEIFLSN